MEDRRDDHAADEEGREGLDDELAPDGVTRLVVLKHMARRAKDFEVVAAVVVTVPIAMMDVQDGWRFVPSAAAASRKGGLERDARRATAAVACFARAGECGRKVHLDSFEWRPSACPSCALTRAKALCRVSVMPGELAAAAGALPCHVLLRPGLFVEAGDGAVPDLRRRNPLELCAAALAVARLHAAPFQTNAALRTNVSSKRATAMEDRTADNALPRVSWHKEVCYAADGQGQENKACDAE